MNPLLQKHVRGSFLQPIEFHSLSDWQWVGQRMARKVWGLLDISFSPGDRVFVLDTDLLIQGDIFAGFDGTFDVGLTTRHYDYWYRVNGGVWGFQVNPGVAPSSNSSPPRFASRRGSLLSNSKRALSRNAPLPPTGVWIGGAIRIFCALFWIIGYLSPATIGDLGYQYNFCPSVEDDVPGTFEKARDEILAKLGDPDIKVLHFKGRLKEVLAGVRHLV